MVVALLGTQFHRHDIGACSRLRHCERTHMFPRHKARQIFPLLLGRTVEADLIDTKIGMGPIRKRYRCGRTCDFLDHDGMGKIAHTGTTIFFLDCNPQKAELSHFLPQFGRKIVGLVDVCRHWRDPGLGPVMNHGSQCLDFVSQCKIHAGVKHGSLLRMSARICVQMAFAGGACQHCPEPSSRKFPRPGELKGGRQNGTRW